MNKFWLLAILVSIFSFDYAQAQDNEKKTLENFNRIDVFSPGYEYEALLSRNFYFNVGIRSDFIIRHSNSANNDSPFHYWSYTDQAVKSTGIFLLPYIESGLRWNYNQDKRKATGRSTQFNSGNYFKLAGRYYSKDAYLPIYQKNVDGLSYSNFALSILWGIRRPISEHLVFDFYLGSEFDFNEPSGIRPLLGIRLGIPVAAK